MGHTRASHHTPSTPRHSQQSSHVHTATVEIIHRHPQPTNCRRQPLICNQSAAPLPCHQSKRYKTRASLAGLQPVRRILSHLALSLALSLASSFCVKWRETYESRPATHNTHTQTPYTHHQRSSQWLPAGMRFVSTRAEFSPPTGQFAIKPRAGRVAWRRPLDIQVLLCMKYYYADATWI